MEVEKEFPREVKIKVLLSVFEANILRGILKKDNLFNGRFKQNLLYFLEQHLTEIKEEMRRKK